MRRSIFMRTYVSSISLVVLAFIISSQVFLVQLRRYADSERLDRMTATASSVGELMEDAGQLNDSNVNDLMLSYLQRTAINNNTMLLLADPEGQVTLAVSPDGAMYSPDIRINDDVMREIGETGRYYAKNQYKNVFPINNGYVLGLPSTNDAGNVMLYVFVASNDENVVGVIERISSSFTLILILTLAGTMLLCYFLSERVTRPLKVMVLAAREYAQGDFDSRVPEDNRCTEIDELAVAFNNMARDLQQLDDLTKGFIGNVSHEFKTPMTTIGGFVDGMLDGTIPPDQQQKYLHVISDEVKRLSRMVMRMLDAAKIQSGELLLNSAPFDFTEMSSEIILSFEQKLNAKQIDVQVDFADRLMVMGDRDHVYRAVYNLVDNAVKFVDQGGRLQLSAYPAGAMCEFSITNTGGDIAPEEIAHLFDRFYKTDKSRSRDRTGAGLGLYIVKNIINLHGGEISVRSGGGETEFSFTLPLAPVTKTRKLGDTGRIE